MTNVFAALIGALTLVRWLVAAAPPPSPLPSPGSPVPCGYVDFIPAGPPHYEGGTAYERIKAIVTFPDGHRESDVFPYFWVYSNGEQTDPWSDTNLRRGQFAVTLQRPPAGADVSAYPPLIKYVLDHSDANGYTALQSCPRPTGKSEAVADPVQRVPLDTGKGPTQPVWLTLADLTVPDAPVKVVDAFSITRRTAERIRTLRTSA